MRGRSERAGLSFAAACAALGAFVAPVARLTTERGDPLFVATASTAFAALASVVVLAARGQLAALFRGREGFLLAWLGLFGTTIPNLLFFFGTSRTSAIDAVLCLQIEPLYSLLLAWLALGHRLTLPRVLAAGALLVGIVCATTGGGSSRDPLGIALLLATPLSWQLSHLMVKRRLAHASPELLTGARYLWGGLWLAGVAVMLSLLLKRPLLSETTAGAQLPTLAFQGVVLAFVGTMLWYQAIARLDLARATAIVVPSIPLLSLAAGFALVGEVPTGRQLAGMLLVAGGVLAFVRAPHAVEARERVPTPTAPLAVPTRAEGGGDAA